MIRVLKPCTLEEVMTVLKSTRCDEPKCNRPMPFDIQSPTAKLMILNVLLAEKFAESY